MFPVLLLPLITGGTLWGQDDSEAPDKIFDKGGVDNKNKIVANVNSNVNMYTGQANISIPIAQIEADGLTIPLTLSYNTGGLKVGDVSGLVGLGWNFSTGVLVSRSLAGPKSDFWLTQGYVAMRGDSQERWDDLKKTLLSKGKDRLEYWTFTFQKQDGQPDICSFEIPGASGIFVFGRDGKTYTIPDKNIKIEYLDQFGEAIKITDPNGYEYYFGSLYKNPNSRIIVGDYLEASIWWDNEHVTTWHPIKIVKDGKDIVTYEYEAGESYRHYVYDKVYSVKYTSRDGSISGPDIDDSDVMRNDVNIVSPKYVKTIRTENMVISFSYDATTRHDVENMRLLKSIEITDKNNGLKTQSVFFNYSAFFNGAPKLKNITGQVRDSKIKTLYVFDYEESVNLPERDSPSYDYWGYYNGAANENRCPSFTAVDSVTLLRFSYTGADREPNFQYTKANVLQRIRYQNGGYTEFEYEPHITADNKIIGGLRTKSVATYDEFGRVASSVKYEYNDLATKQSSGQCFRYPDPSPIVSSRQYIGAPLINTFVTIQYQVNERYPFPLFDFNGAAIVYPMAQEIYANNSYKNVSFYSYSDFPDKKADIWIIGAHDQKDHAQRDYRQVPATSYWWARGMVKSNEIYNAYNGLESRETFIYELDDEPKNVFVNRIPFMTMGGMAAYFQEEKEYGRFQFKVGMFQTISQGIKLKTHIVERSRYNRGYTKNYTYHPDYGVPTCIVQQDSVNTIETHIKYPFDFAVPDNNVDELSPEVTAILNMQDRGIFVPIETYIKRNGKVVKGQVSTFKHVTQSDYKTTGVKLWQTYDLVINNPITDYSEAAIENGDFNIDDRYVVVQKSAHYDGNGNLTNIYTPRTAKNSSYIYDKYRNPIAEISNAVYAEPEYHASEIVVKSTETPGFDGYTFKIDVPSKREVGILITHYSYDEVSDDPAQRKHMVRITNYDVFPSPGYIDIEAVCGITKYIELEAGQYSITPYGSSTCGFREGPVYASYYDGETVYNKENQIYYTSFENDNSTVGIVDSVNAKTGSAVMTRQLNIDMRNFKPGKYKLSYWKSNDSGNSWVKVTEALTVGNSTEEYTIGQNENLGYWIDEVRIYPENARMTTMTYIPDQGKTSQMDHNGKVQYWEYDEMGRPSKILNNEREVLREFEYHELEIN